MGNPGNGGTLMTTFVDNFWEIWGTFLLCSIFMTTIIWPAALFSQIGPWQGDKNYITEAEQIPVQQSLLPNDVATALTKARAGISFCVVLDSGELFVDLDHGNHHNIIIYTIHTSHTLAIIDKSTHLAVVPFKKYNFKQFFDPTLHKIQPPLSTTWRRLDRAQARVHDYRTARYCTAAGGLEGVAKNCFKK